MTTTDPFGQAPASTAGGAFVKLHQLASGADKVTREYASGDEDRHQTVKTSGRLVLMKPVKVETVPKMGTTKGETVQRWSVDVHVLNGDPITVSVNGNTREETDLPEPVEPGTKTAKIEGMYVTAAMLGDQLRQKADDGGGYLLGRIGSLKARAGQNAPYVLCEYTPDEAQLAREYLAKFDNPFAG